MTIHRVCVIGSGYVGTVVAAGLAHIGHQVVGVEADVDKLAQLQIEVTPFHKEGLERVAGRRTELRTTVVSNGYRWGDGASRHRLHLRRNSPGPFRGTRHE